MHLVSLEDVTLRTRDADSLHFAGHRGERGAISVLDHDLVRVQLWPDGSPRLDRTWCVVDASGDVPLEGRSRGDLSPFPRPGLRVEETPEGLTICTDALAVDVRLGDLRLVWRLPSGEEFAADIPTRAHTYDRAGRAVFHHMARHADERYYGFGEKAGPLDKAGMRLRMCNVDAYGYDAARTDPLYKHIPFYITLVPELGVAYGIFYDNLSETVFDMGREVNALRGGYYRAYQAADGDLDYYLIFGPSIEAVVEKYTALTGRPMLPPRWSFGYLASTMAYTEAPNAQEQLGRFVTLCDEHDIPCDLFHLSSGYSTDAEGRRNVFTWNQQRIPDPATMAARFHSRGIRLAPNIKPYLLTTHPHYDDLAARGGFIRSASGDRPELNLFWSGGAYQTAPGSYVDFSSRAGYTWWQARIADALLDHGIDAIWNDNNEFEVWDDSAQADGFGQPIPMGMARPIQTLLMGCCSYEALAQRRPDERPFVLSRAGSPGIQRYAQTWTGDNTTSWETLRWNIPMGLGLGLSGLGNMGHDVGGFAGPKPDPELFVRWVQNGIFHPRFTIHSWNEDGTVNEPWMYPEVLSLVRDALRFRYRLIPYLYSLAVEMARTGHPMLRPLVYHFPDDPRCQTESFDFLLGPGLLVASVTEPGATSRDVYLPAGTDWYDYANGTRYTGGQTVTLDAPLDRIPLLARAGALIPLGKPVRNVGAEPDDWREVRAYPPIESGEAHFTLVEDDGHSLAYRRGAYTELRLTVRTTPDTLALSAEPVHAGYPLAYEAIEFALPPTETRPLDPPAETWTDSDSWRRARVPVHGVS